MWLSGNAPTGIHWDAASIPVWLSGNAPTSIHWDAASIPGLRIRHCPELWYRSQTRFGSCVAVAVAYADSCSFNSTPSLGTSICHGYSPERSLNKQTNKQTNKQGSLWLPYGKLTARSDYSRCWQNRKEAVSTIVQTRNIRHYMRRKQGVARYGGVPQLKSRTDEG